VVTALARSDRRRPLIEDRLTFLGEFVPAEATNSETNHNCRLCWYHLSFRWPADAVHDQAPPHSQAIRLLFGIKDPPQITKDWPGVISCCMSLEQKLQVLIKDDFNALWRVLDCPKPTVAENCWGWCFAVLEVFRAPENHECSLEKAYQTLILKKGKSSTEFSSSEKIRIMWTMFAVLCWTSATLAPIDDTGAADSTRDADLFTVQISSKLYSANGIKRPFYKMLRTFRHDPGDARPHMNGEKAATDHMARFDEVIYESNLNYSTLITVGRVKLNWVDDLASHLAFDRRRRTVCVFRAPSYCVAKLLGENDFKYEER
jgi:hypothetical protein